MEQFNKTKLSIALLTATAVLSATNTHAAAFLTNVGLWEFENAANLTTATTGTNLTESGTGFTAVAGSGGSDTGAAQVALGSYYTMSHGIAPNGGGSLLNEYSMLIDFKLDTATTNEWTTFFQSDTTNSVDGDYFYSQSRGALGVTSQEYVGGPDAVALDQWHRLVISVNNNGDTNSYLDGVFLGTHTQGVVDGRWALDSDVIMFGDNDGDDGLINVSTLAIYDKAISISTAVQLGVAGDATNIENNLVVGDTNGDEMVLLNDYEALRDHFGVGTTLADGDVDFDGDVDQEDFLIIRNEFPKYNSGASLASAIPEPASIFLFGMGSLAVLKRNKK